MSRSIILGCIAMGGMYFAKVPVKKALEEAGLAEMTMAEKLSGTCWNAFPSALATW
jgi:hypothetical protein